MKKELHIKSFVCCSLQIVFVNFQLLAQGTWTPKTNFSGAGRFWATGFSMGNKGYIGTGDRGAYCWDFWEYDQATDSWKQKANAQFGGLGRSNAVGFSIGTKGYIGTGRNGTYTKDFWEWDQATNVWTQKADFGGTARSRATGFSIGTKGYIGTGYTPALQKDFWEWDQATNIWTKKSDFGGTATQYATSFSIGTKGYIGASFGNSLWEWNQATDVWTQKASFGGNTRFGAVGFAISTKGYIGTGTDNTGYRKDFWQWDQATNTWAQMTDFGGTARNYAVGFSIGCKGYIGTGYDLNGTLQNDFWEFCPDTACCSNKLSLTTSSQNIPCYGQCTGTAIASATGGSGSYTYQWGTAPAQTGQTATGLCNGTYTVTISDSNGATATATVTITQPAAAITLNANSTNNSNCITPNGTATINANGGTTGYSYLWNSSPVQTTQTAIGLAAGTYTALVTDANGCTQTQTVSISGPVSPSATVASTNVLCHGGSTGNAAVTAFGGSTPYTYSWNTNPAQSTSTANGLSAGTYIALITDSNGCTSTQTVAITEPTALTTTITSAATTCNNNNGSATATANGGTPGYSYNWTTIPTQTNATATALSGGITYTVIITDFNGCTQTQTATIAPSAGPSISLTAQSNVLCNGGNTASATVTASAGTIPYTYSWNTALVQTSPTATGLSAGTYTCTITDASGCTGMQTVTITEPKALAITPSATQTDCNDSTGTATASVTGGTPGYNYLWIPTNQTTPTATGLGANTYTITVTDANNCMQNDIVTVSEISCPCRDLNLPNAFSPNDDGENDGFCLQGATEDCITNLHITIYDRWGETVYESTKKNFCWDGACDVTIMNTAVFVYYLEAILITGENKNITGNISLIK